jgi:hypothetical protein
MLPILIPIGKNPKDSNAKAAYFSDPEFPVTPYPALSCLDIRFCPAQDSSAA